MAALLVFLFSAANAASGICHPNAYLGMMDCFLAEQRVCSTKSAVSASSCVWSGLGRSVGRFPSPPHAVVVVLALSSLATDRPRPRDRPTDRATERRKSVVPAPASVFPPARRLVVMFVGAIPLPSLSGPANDSPTDRREGKDGCRKR